MGLIKKLQDRQKKKTFLTRSKSALFVFAFYVIYVLLLVFSDQRWMPWGNHPNANNISFILNFFNVLMMIPIIYLVAKEITNLCFPKRKGIFWYTTVALFIQTVGTSLYLLCMRYKMFGNLMPIGIGLDCFDWFLLISLAGIVFFTITSTLVWVVLSRHITYVGKKTRFWFPCLIFIMNTFFVGFIYTTIIHTWTTFIFLILLSNLCDIFAYIGGVNFGKNKMAPTISPKKTWEGVVFGAAISLVVMCGLYCIFYFIPGAETFRGTHTLYCFLGCQTCSMEMEGWGLINLQPYYWAIYVATTLLLIVVSILGDLFFSWIKRRFNIKDFSNLLPGHGGILDRLDALIFTFSFYFLVTIILQLATKNTAGLQFLWNQLSSVL